MKTGLCILLMCISVCVFAQADLNYVSLYTTKSNVLHNGTYVINTVFDESGNRYVLLISYGDVSAINQYGDTNVLISDTNTVNGQSNHTYVVVKYNRQQQPLYSLKIEVKSSVNLTNYSNYNVSMRVLPDGNFLLTGSFYVASQIRLIDGQGVLAENVVATYSGNQAISLVWCTNNLGNSKFVNAVHHKFGCDVVNNNPNPIFRITCVDMQVDGSMNVYIDKLRVDSYIHESVVRYKGNVTPIPLTQDAILHFDANGVYKNLVAHRYTKNSTVDVHSSVLFIDHLKPGTLIFQRIKLSQPDTLMDGNTVLDTGQYYVLGCYDSSNRYVWSRVVGKGDDDVNFSFDKELHTNSLLFGISFSKSSFQSTDTLNLSPFQNKLIYLVKLNANTGDNVWQSVVGNSTYVKLDRWSYNPLAKGTYLSLTYAGEQVTIGNYTHQNARAGIEIRPTIFYLDSLNQVKGASTFFVYPFNLTSLNFFFTVGHTHFVWPTDYKGSYYLGGSFVDSIDIGCNGMIKSNRNTLYYKFAGIELSYNPLNPTIDTVLCEAAYSPGGNVFWDTSGLYADTITTTTGCKKVVNYEVKVAMPQPVLKLSNPLSCSNPSATLMADVGANNFNWNPTKFLKGSTELAVVITEQDTNLWYYLSYMDTLGCKRLDSMYVSSTFYRNDVANIPNVITPNEDGINDCISGELWGSNWVDVTFTVYNRWGDRVYQTHEVGFCWDGELADGTSLPQGVYYYVIEGVLGCDEDYHYSGVLHLIR